LRVKIIINALDQPLRSFQIRQRELSQTQN